MMYRGHEAIGHASYLLFSTLTLALASACQAGAGEASVLSQTGVKPYTATSHHSIKLGNEEIRYTAIASKIILRGKDGKPTASMFYIAYTKNGARENRRPITFIYGGGPGSTSNGLQMVGFGPKLVVTADHAHTPPAPYRIVNNPYSLLNVTDMVFVEEVGTGYSRLLGDSKISQFAGVDEDAEAFKQFIVRYLNKYKRWNSPKYLMGNSYGTTRDAVLANDLQGAGIDLQGVVLISTVLNFQTLEFHSGNDLPYILYLPTYAAIARYHHTLSKKIESEPLRQFLKKVESFAIGEYAHFLLEGNLASEQERRRVAQKMSQYIGLSEQYIRYSNFRIPQSAFRKELLRNKNLVVGRTDGRFVGMDYDQATYRAEYDPLGAAVGGPYIVSMNFLLREFLHYDVSGLWKGNCYSTCHWDWLREPRRGHYSFRQGYADVSTDLSHAMIDNPQLKIFAACGYYDLATAYFAAKYTYAHLNVGSLQKNITIKCYKSGHVMYLRPKTHARMYRDLVHFYQSSS